ncbi:MarR family EPS-associated transcriptional regulator [Rhodoferax antarcticus]|uniref:MarR family EPS-associated transcriptional regulator n=1 Tax=Rhodoferax antarcticus TaxID=81479 RepID=UPI0029FF5660|nr:MarR family EPS-associated transcriptional regulator [Rhodoferax antarcticus]MCW2312626.1 EPS-associated MarR family transcriptional regulator [Rhodoferax antarcticus]
MLIIGDPTFGDAVNALYDAQSTLCREINPKVALITGITGQDGSYLAELNYTEWRRTGLPANLAKAEMAQHKGIILAGGSGTRVSIRVHQMNQPQLSPLHEETHLKVLRLLEGNPRLSQREVSEALGVSLGKTNFCFKALVDKGLIKVQSFRKSQNKLAYAYLLTPVGIAEKSALTARFLKRKMVEYEHLQAEIAVLQLEVSGEPASEKP